MKRGCCIFMISMLLILCGCSERNQDNLADAHDEETAYSSTILAMDTVMNLTVYGEDNIGLLDSAEEYIVYLEDLLSATKETSEIYCVNDSGGETVELSEDTYDLLIQSLEFCDETGGVLDISIYPVLLAWGFTTGEYHVPSDDEIKLLLQNVSYEKIIAEDQSVRIPENMKIDLGALAKGYTGDKVCELLSESGVHTAILNLGGDVRTLGSKPDGSPWRVAIQDPTGDGYAGVVEFTGDLSIVTSGGYERFFEENGEVYWHIIDPATGYPAKSGLISVSIISDSGTYADALSTALFIMGADQAETYWKEHDGFDYILITEDESVIITEGIENGFSLTDDWAEHELEVVRK